jgi:hypothetical protein
MATSTIIDTAATIMCPHGGQVSIVSSNTRVKVGGAFATTISDTFTVSGCPFQVPVGAGTKPQPCIKLQWTVPATRVRVNGQFVLLQTSTGLSLSAEQIPQGPPSVVLTQMRVKAT